MSEISGSGADTIVTGNWGTDLLRLVRAAADAKFKARFVAMFLDLPGNVTGAGDAAEGQYNVDVFNAEASSDRGLGLLKDFREKTGSPNFLNSHARTIFALQFLGEALKRSKSTDGKIDVQAIALALETAQFNSAAGPISTKPGHHQAILPVTITQVSKGAVGRRDIFGASNANVGPDAPYKFVFSTS